MAYSNNQRRRYEIIRTYIHRMYPNLVTAYNSGLPKKPLPIGFGEKILRVKSQWSQVDWMVLNNRPIIITGRLEPRGPIVDNEVRFGYGRSYTTFSEDVQFFLRIYCQGLRYWSACAKPDSHRHNILGNPSIPLTAEHRQHAVNMLGIVLAKGSGRARYLKMLQKERANAGA